MVPLSPGRVERHGVEYYRQGTLSLYVALEVKTGKVEGKTAERHTSAEFLAFLQDLLKKARRAKEIHIVLDNLSAHQTKGSCRRTRRCVSTSRRPILAGSIR